MSFIEIGTSSIQCDLTKIIKNPNLIALESTAGFKLSANLGPAGNLVERGGIPHRHDPVIPLDRTAIRGKGLHFTNWYQQQPPTSVGGNCGSLCKAPQAPENVKKIF